MIERSLTLNPDAASAQVFRGLIALRAKTSPSELNRIARELSAIETGAAISVVWTFHALLQSRDYPLVLKYLADHPGRHISQWSDCPVELLRAITLQLAGRDDEARAEYERAREILEASEAPDMRTHGGLALVYAGLGRKDDALREGLRSLELMPYEKDSIVHQALRLDHAVALVQIGELERAAEELRLYLSRPALRPAARRRGVPRARRGRARGVSGHLVD